MSFLYYNTICLLKHDTFTQLTCQAVCLGHTFTSFIFVKETLFCMTSEIRQLTSQPICACYIFSLTGNLIFCFGLFCTLLSLLSCLEL